MTCSLIQTAFFALSRPHFADFFCTSNENFIIRVTLIFSPLRMLRHTMVIRFVEFSSGGINKKDFCVSKNQHTQRKLLNFENWWNFEMSTIGTILVINGCKYWRYQRMSRTKYLFLWYSSMKKRGNIQMILDIESQIFALFDTSPLHQCSKFNHFP